MILMIMGLYSHNPQHWKFSVLHVWCTFSFPRALCWFCSIICRPLPGIRKL